MSEEKSLAGWVFRIEIVTNKPDTLTTEMKPRILEKLRSMENVEMVAIEELFEEVRLFKKKKEKTQHE